MSETVENLADILGHIGRASAIIEDMAQTEKELDLLFYARTIHSVAPVPSQFFNSVSSVEKAFEPFQPVSSEPGDETDWAKTIAVNIKKIRKEKGYTQKKLSDMTGIMRPNIARLERGATVPNLNTLIKVAKGLNVSLVKFFI
jgi:DNA-binding XRE family transcriptional regulator